MKQEAAYLQLYKKVREVIVGGIYPTGSKLPSKRMMAQQWGVGLITVAHAYELLIDEGYIEARQRSGYFVIFRTDDGFASSPRNVTVTKHEGGSAEFPLTVLQRTMRAVMGDYGADILERSDNKGCPELRRAIRGYLARSRGIQAQIDQIVIGSGSEYLYRMIVELLGRERIYGIESPSYKKIEQVYRAAGVRVEMLTLGQDGIDSAALRKAKADILHISPYRSFPSGVSASASKRHEYLRWAEAGRFIVEDDFESEFSVSKKAEETLFSYAPYENVIYMNTFSQTVSPSLRVGYMVLPPGLVETFEEKLGFYSCTVPTYVQLVLARLIENGDFERQINRVRRQKRKAWVQK